MKEKMTLTKNTGNPIYLYKINFYADKNKNYGFAQFKTLAKAKDYIKRYLELDPNCKVEYNF